MLLLQCSARCHNAIPPLFNEWSYCCNCDVLKSRATFFWLLLYMHEALIHLHENVLGCFSSFKFSSHIYYSNLLSGRANSPWSQNCVVAIMATFKKFYNWYCSIFWLSCTVEGNKKYCSLFKPNVNTCFYNTICDLCNVGPLCQYTHCLFV